MLKLHYFDLLWIEVMEFGLVSSTADVQSDGDLSHTMSTTVELNWHVAIIYLSLQKVWDKVPVPLFLKIRVFQKPARSVQPFRQTDIVARAKTRKPLIEDKTNSAVCLTPSHDTEISAGSLLPIFFLTTNGFETSNFKPHFELSSQRTAFTAEK